MTKVTLGAKAERIYEELRQRILDGVYAVNARIPPGKELCTEFNISRTPVKNALARLIAEGFIVSRQGSGTFVCERKAGKGRSNTISVMFNGTLAELTMIQELITEENYLLCLYSQIRNHWNAQAEAAFYRRIGAQHHQALLANCSPLDLSQLHLLTELARNGMRVIHLEPYSDKVPEELEYAIPDYRHAGHVAAVHLMLNTVDEFFFVDMAYHAPYALMAQTGYFEGLREHDRLQEKEETCTLVLEPKGFLSVTSLERLAKAFADTQKKVGFFCSTSERGAVLSRSLQHHFGVSADRVSILGLHFEGERTGSMDNLCYPVRCIDFDRRQLIIDAVKAAASSDHPPLHKLYPPTLRREGGLKSNTPS